jgi:hypothetical protein
MRLEFNTANAQPSPFRLLLLSDFGVGKTYMIGYLDKRLKEITGRGIKLFDFDIGWQTLKTASFALDATSYLINLEKQGEAFEEFDEDFHKYLANPGPYSGFAIDSLSSLQTAAMDYVFSINKINRRLNLANENDYGVLVTTMQQILPQILQISRHSIFVMTAQTREKTNLTTGANETLPAITGRSLPSQIGAWFNEVWCLKAEGYRGDVQRMAQTAAGGSVNCKTQIANMPFELPALEAIDRALEAYQIPLQRNPELMESHADNMDNVEVDRPLTI